MKITGILALITITALTIFLAFGCGQGQQGKTFGSSITETALTPIGTILASPEQFAGKTVKIEGKIMNECPTGGWFHLSDATGTIYVNLHPSEVAIPQIMNHKVVAQGRVRKEGTQVEIIGEGVQIK
jgi:uncharacterized protein YdeI (BOF family)